IVSTERHVEIPAFIKPAETVEARPVQVVKQLCALFGKRLSLASQMVEAIPMLVEEFFVIAHGQVHLQPLLHVTIKIDEVRIHVVEQRLLRLQTEHYRKSTAKRFHVTTVRVRFPDRLELRD